MVAVKTLFRWFLYLVVAVCVLLWIGAGVGFFLLGGFVDPIFFVPAVLMLIATFYFNHKLK